MAQRLSHAFTGFSSLYGEPEYWVMHGIKSDLVAIAWEKCPFLYKWMWQAWVCAHRSRTCIQQQNRPWFFQLFLRYQLKDRGIGVSVLCPGPVYTKPEIEIETKRNLASWVNWWLWNRAGEGEVAVKKTLKGKLMIIPGTWNRVMSWVVRFLPRRWSLRPYITTWELKMGGKKSSNRNKHKAMLVTTVTVV